MTMSQTVPIILAVLAIIALGYLFMANDMPTTTHPMRNSNAPMMNNIENFANVNSHPNHQERDHFEDVPEDVAVQGSEEIGSTLRMFYHLLIFFLVMLTLSGLKLVPPDKVVLLTKTS